MSLTLPTDILVSPLTSAPSSLCLVLLMPGNVIGLGFHLNVNLSIVTPLVSLNPETWVIDGHIFFIIILFSRIWIMIVLIH